MEAAVGPVALLVADEPELAAGVTTALLAHDEDVRALREQIGALMAARIDVALGPDAPPAARTGLALAFSGALLSAGMGVLDYASVGPALGGFAALLEPSGVPATRRGKKR
jgi:imidazolonepropionase-like amidohydrolase